MPSKEGGNAYHTLFSFRVNYKEYYDRNNITEVLKMILAHLLLLTVLRTIAVAGLIATTAAVTTVIVMDRKVNNNRGNN